MKQQAVRGLKWQAIEIAGRQLLSLAVFTTLARLLDPAAFGLVGMVGVYLAFVGMFVDQGLSTALIQRKELEPDHLNSAFWFNVACGAALCGLTIVLAGPVARLFNEPQLVPLLRWASLGLLIGSLAGIHGTLFVRAMDFRRPAMRTLVANVAGGGVGVAMAINGFGVWALVGQQLSAAAAGAAFLWIASPWRPTATFSFAHLRQLMGVGSSVFGAGLLWFFSSRLDQIVIGRFLGAGLLGHYVVAGKLPELARLSVHQPVAAVSLPALSKLQHDYRRLREAIYTGMELNALVSFAVFGGLAAVAPTLMPLAFGEQWLRATSLLPLLALYNLMLGLFIYCYPALMASGGPGRYVIGSVVCTIGTVVACIIGIHRGPETLVVGLVVNIAFTGVLQLFFLQSRMGLSPWRYLQPCLVPAAAALCMLLAVHVTRMQLPLSLSRWTCLLLEILVGAVTYLGLIITFSSHSLSHMRQFLPRTTTTPAYAVRTHDKLA